jgi:biotin transport system substrate-specific component
MAAMTHRTAALLDHVVPVRTPALSAAARAFLCAGGGVLLLALLSQVRVPIGPVPVTGQTLGATVSLYLLRGAAGLPVFAGGEAGLAYAFGPTGGYLVGFALAAALLGRLAARGWDKGVLTCAAAMVLANVVVYVPGLLWLKLSLGLGWQATLAAGLAPFMLGDAVKLAIAAAALPAAWRLVGRQG